MTKAEAVAHYKAKLYPDSLDTKTDIVSRVEDDLRTRWAEHMVDCMAKCGIIKIEGSPT